MENQEEAKKKQQRLKYRRYNIIPTIKRLSGLNANFLVPYLEEMAEKDLRLFKKILSNIDSKIMGLQRKARFNPTYF